jgi:hypothetical protein
MIARYADITYLGTYYLLTPEQMADFKNVLIIYIHILTSKDKLILKAGTSDKS